MNLWEDQRTWSLNNLWRRWHFVMCQNCSPVYSFEGEDKEIDLSSSFIKDSIDFIRKIKHLSINPEEETLVSFDVSALFTSIPVLVALHVINSKISTCTNFTSVCKIPTVKFIKLLEFTLTNCIFCFNKKFYKQLQGAAMGSPVSSVIANIYMECFESLAIPAYPTLIKWWFRYVDDVQSTTRKDQVNQLPRTPQFHRSTHQIHHRTPRNRWTPLPRYPNQTHF